MASRVVHTAPEFEKEVRKLRRRFPAVSSQVRQLVSRLIDGDLPGNRVPGTVVQTFKVRLTNPAARRGKRGGFRVYYALYGTDQVVLITIYSKTDANDASLHEVGQRIRKIMKTSRNKDSSEE